MASIISPNAEATIAHGHSLAGTLRRGDVLALSGDLGAGKTHFVKGLAAGLGATCSVTSPTFTLIHEYCGGRIPLYHFDFYRLEDENEALQIGLDEYLEGDGVCVIEWAEKFSALLPPHTRWLRIAHCSDGTRKIEELPAS
jgi:tRNA threonylcarbamoyladenosine biosynthesis protein TsaE